MTPSSTWVYMRGQDAVRIVVDGHSVAVYGPGLRMRHVRFTDEMDAVLYHASVERSLSLGGWILERRLSEPEPSLSFRRGGET